MNSKESNPLSLKVIRQNAMNRVRKAKEEGTWLPLKRPSRDVAVLTNKILKLEQNLRRITFDKAIKRRESEIRSALKLAKAQLDELLEG